MGGVLKEVTGSQKAQIEDAYIQAVSSRHGSLGAVHSILMMALLNVGISVSSWQEALRKAQEILYG